MQQAQGKGSHHFKAQGVNKSQQSLRNAKSQSPPVGAFIPNTRVGRGNKQGKGKGATAEPWYQSQTQAKGSQSHRDKGKGGKKSGNVQPEQRDYGYLDQGLYVLQQSLPAQQKFWGKGKKGQQGGQSMVYQNPFAKQQPVWMNKGEGKNWNVNQSYNIQQSQLPQQQVKGKGKNWNQNQSYAQQSQQGNKQVKGKGKNMSQNQSYGMLGQDQFVHQQAKGKGKNRNRRRKGKGKGDSSEQSQPVQEQNQQRQGKGKGSKQPQNQGLDIAQAQKGKKKKKVQPQQGVKASGGQGHRAKAKNKASNDGLGKWQPKGSDTFAPNPRARASSLLTTLPLVDANDLLADYNARAENFPSGDNLTGPTEIIFMEPTNVTKKKRAGLVIAFHGVEPTKGTMKEWSSIPELAQWFKMGITLALPNIEMHSAVHKTDIEKYVTNAMKSQKVNTCILLGKSWGANVCVQYALDHPKQVKGLILLAPSGPPRLNTKKLQMPALVCWTEGDPVIPFEEASEFVEEMRDRVAPTCFKMSDEATHDFAEVMRSDSDIAEVMKHFVASALIMAQPDKTKVAKRLSNSLPEKFRSNDPVDLRQLATKGLPDWCRAGMVLAQE